MGRNVANRAETRSRPSVLNRFVAFAWTIAQRIERHGPLATGHGDNRATGHRPQRAAAAATDHAATWTTTGQHGPPPLRATDHGQHGPPAATGQHGPPITGHRSRHRSRRRRWPPITPPRGLQRAATGRRRYGPPITANTARRPLRANTGRRRSRPPPITGHVPCLKLRRPPPILKLRQSAAGVVAVSN